jgi:hypothetical protein
VIRIAFVGPQRKIISFEVDGRVIKYFDDVWKDGVQIIPQDTNFVRKLLRSGNPEFKMLAALIFDANKGENLEEYISCDTEEDLIDFIRKDMELKGLMEVK